MILLKEYIKNFLKESILNESVQDEVFLLNVIDKFFKDSNFKVWLYDLGDKIRIGYDNEEKDPTSVGSDLSKEIFGFIELNRYGSGNKAIAKGEENSAWCVSNVKATKGLGLGSLLYEIALEYISNNKSASIMADPNFVKDNAKRVWERLSKRSDVKKLQLDIHKNRLRNLKKELNDDSLSQLTPDYLQDDVLMSSAIKDKGRDWKDSVLSKAYKKENNTIIDKLKREKIIIFL